MKKILKTIVNVTAMLLMAICCFSFTACGENTVKATFVLEVSGEEQTLSMTFDKDVAPDTIDAISDLIESGFYNGAFFYKFTANNTNQVMFGDLKFEDGKIVQIKTKNDKLPDMLKGEFAYGSRTGSNIKYEEGSIGLWRSWYNSSIGYMYSTGNDTGRSTLFMPTTTSSTMDGYFCLFGSFDKADKTWSNIKEVFASNTADYYTLYTVFYTKNPDNPSDGTLTFNCLTTEEFNNTKSQYKDIDNNSTIFSVEDNNALQSFNSYEIKVPTIFKDETLSARIKVKSVKIG